MLNQRQAKKRFSQGKAYLSSLIDPKKYIYLYCSSKIADNTGASQGQVLYHFAETADTLVHTRFANQHSASANAELTSANNET